MFGLIYWTRYARVIRGEVLSLRERDYVRLAQVAGLSEARIIIRHIVPNVLNTWMVLASLTVGVVIITEASLSFLGLGVQAPTPAWGHDAGRGPRDPDGRPVVADAVPGHLHLGRGAGRQPVRRLAAREARPAAAQPPMSEPLLRVSGPAQAYTRRSVAERVRAPWTARASPSTGARASGVVGESGSGKTTTCLSVVRLLPKGAAIGGEVIFDGVDLLKLPSSEMQRVRGQADRDDPAGPDGVAQPAADDRRPGRRAGLLPSGAAWRGSRSHVIVAAALGAHPVAGRADARVSAPDERRHAPAVVGAIALSGEPELIIADEPTTNLDVTIQAQYLNMLKDLQRRTGVACSSSPTTWASSPRCAIGSR